MTIDPFAVFGLEVEPYNEGVKITVINDGNNEENSTTLGPLGTKHLLKYLQEVVSLFQSSISNE